MDSKRSKTADPLTIKKPLCTVVRLASRPFTIGLTVQPMPPMQKKIPTARPRTDDIAVASPIPFAPPVNTARSPADEAHSLNHLFANAQVGSTMLWLVCLVAAGGIAFAAEPDRRNHQRRAGQRSEIAVASCKLGVNGQPV